MNDEFTHHFIRHLIPLSAPMVHVFACGEPGNPGYYTERIAALALVDMWQSDVEDEGEKAPPRGIVPNRWVEPLRLVDRETLTTASPDSHELWLGLYWESELTDPAIHQKLMDLANRARAPEREP